jgi:hypothetical protein
LNRLTHGVPVLERLAWSIWSTVPATCPSLRRPVLSTAAGTFNLIASRWSLQRLLGLAIAYPERYLACSIRLSALEFELHVAHISPGASRCLIKVEMFEALYRRLATCSEKPRILCGDFNTPRFESPDGTVGFWGLRHRHIWNAGTPPRAA